MGVQSGSDRQGSIAQHFPFLGKDSGFATGFQAGSECTKTSETQVVPPTQQPTFGSRKQDEDHYSEK